MSYEGYNQILCKKGHLSAQDAFFSESDFKCRCGEKIAWYNPVDETNCESYGLISQRELNKFLLTEEQQCSCKHCGHKHTAVEATYRIPTKEETKLARQLSQEKRNKE